MLNATESDALISFHVFEVLTVSIDMSHYTLVHEKEMVELGIPWQAQRQFHVPTPTHRYSKPTPIALITESDTASGSLNSPSSDLKHA